MSGVILSTVSYRKEFKYVSSETYLSVYVNLPKMPMYTLLCFYIKFSQSSLTDLYSNLHSLDSFIEQT